MGDLIILIFHVTSRDHVVKSLYNFMGGSPWQEFSILPCLVSMDLVEEKIENLICHVTLQDYVLRDYVTLWMGALHGKLRLCKVWWPYAL